MYVIEIINSEVYFLSKGEDRTSWTNSLRESKKFETKEDAQKIINTLDIPNVRIKDISNYVIW